MKIGMKGFMPKKSKYTDDLGMQLQLFSMPAAYNAVTTAVSNADCRGANRLVPAVLTVYSQDIMFHAQPVLRYEQFATKKVDLTVNPGLTVVFMRYNNLTGGGRLTENLPMTTQALSASQISISVAEHGNAVSVSELLLQSAFHDVLASGARLLGLDYARTLDNMLRNVVLSSPNIYYAGQRTNVSQLTTADIFNSNVVKDAVEILATKNVRKFNGDAYICFVHPHQVRSLRNDTDFKNAKDYQAIYAGEVGRIDDVVFIETTQQPILVRNLADAYAQHIPVGIQVYQAVMFGDNAYGLATALPVEMRDGGVIDFGRQHNLAWYSIQGAGIIEGDNILRVETT